MRTFETYEVSIHLEDADAPHPDILYQRFAGKRRTRVAPSSVLIKWRRAPHTNHWQCTDIAVFGNQVHKTSSDYIGVYYLGGGSNYPPIVMPAWVADIVTQYDPDRQEAMERS